MAIRLEHIHPMFGSRVEGIDLLNLTDSEFAEIEQAFRDRAVLVFPGQPMTDESQVSFSRRFGQLETTMVNDPSGGGDPVTRITNVDSDGNLVVPPEGERDWTEGNELWHTDSSFKATPAFASILSGRVVTDEGGGTEFATMVGAYEALPADRRDELEGLVAEHSLAHSRSLLGMEMSSDFQAEIPPVKQALIRDIPETGQRTLYVGAHASHVEDWPQDRGRILLDALNAWVTQPPFTFEHRWTQDDLLIWDNRRCLHRARPFDRTKSKRVMHRTTVAGEEPTA